MSNSDSFYLDKMESFTSYLRRHERPIRPARKRKAESLFEYDKEEADRLAEEFRRVIAYAPRKWYW